jgi:hypothetical protein
LEKELVFALAFDLREIDELNEILGYLPTPIDSNTLDLLKKISGGSDHPDDESAAAAREHQYELYLGTVLRRAGVTARHGAPDLAATWRSKTFFIEAKRPSSISRVDDRLRKAVHQIRRLPSPGIIALSLDQVLRPAHGILGVRGPDDLAPAVELLIQQFEFEHAHVLRKRLANEPVAALLMTARIPGRLESTGHTALGSCLRTMRVQLSCEESDAGAFIEKVVEAYMKAQS